MFCWQPRTGPDACTTCGPMLSRVLTDPAALPQEGRPSAWVREVMDEADPKTFRAEREGRWIDD
mgnify:CR=1 FL=1